ncbi:hypothetical protein CAPN006_16700 [Capnocytophaga canimorsus]|uniref:hypothetical protein n=1 Tax=Capnocytophaga canimorsus TaxID=28188 RepID=UPI001ACE5DC0|nr:hypothetical protein [Capnocytophaga canimorsus]GIM57277.1 hypothetical protein CAPN006_16700 [Capnocytophaga canimorsus]
MIEKLNTYIGSNRKNIEKKIEDWVRNQLLEDYSKYYDLNIINEVYNISVVDVKVSYDKHLLTYVDDEYIATEMNFEVSYQVNILTDDEDTMYKDDDTKELKYFDTIEIPIKDERNIKADVIFYLKDDNKIDSFDIEEINKGKPLTIRNKKYKDDYQ